MNALRLGGILLLCAVSSGPLAARPSTGCAGHWEIILDRDSFANNGAGRTFSADALRVFQAKLATALKSAINRACASGQVSPGDAQMVRRVMVHSASGASEPHFYSAGDHTLHFEWVFAEEGLMIPADADIAAGVFCWSRPGNKGCEPEGD